MCRMEVEPAFLVDDCEEEFSDGPAVSGYQYLKRVQREAASCPQVVVADIDVSGFVNKQTVVLSKTSGLVAAPGGMQPSVSWENQQVSAFSELRQGLARYLANENPEGTGPCKPLPKRTDRMAWYKFCFGDDLKQKRTSDRGDVSALDCSMDGNEECQMEEQRSQEPQQSQAGMPPLLSVVTRMDQLTVMTVLEYHIVWFREHGYSKPQGQWLYALLACLDKPLLPDVTSLLRSLARSCADLRSTLDDPRHELVAPLNLLITIVARYFEQRDLIKDG